MSKLKEADFYYGAVLSTLFNNGISPMLIEGGNDRQVYDFTTDCKNFRLFVKYRSSGREGAKNGYMSWQFTFSDQDIKELKQYIVDDRHLSLGLVCGDETLNKSQYAVLHKEEIIKVLEAEKESLTLSRMKGERAFRLSLGGGRDSSERIPSNRLF